MPDGWMARARGPDWGAAAELAKPKRIAWHELKSAVIYRWEQLAETAGGRGLLVEKHVVATPPETSPVTSAPACWPQHAAADWSGHKTAIPNNPFVRRRFCRANGLFGIADIMLA